jgi:hypothetical protein
MKRFNKSFTKDSYADLGQSIKGRDGRGRNTLYDRHQINNEAVMTADAMDVGLNG